ncbi:ABC transporter ATP-binding protein, partial [bacterium]|nr:ABC transporter ATP-binding protein [bacterium]
GGQRQRIAIARALILHPKIVVLDEPTSALDVTVQSQIVEMLKNLQKKYEMTYIFISHDMRAIKSISDRIAVMKDGNIVEISTSANILSNPQKAYTKELIRASLI